MVWFCSESQDSTKGRFQTGYFLKLKCQLNTYLIFCEYFQKPVFPLKKETLSAYACFLSENLSSHGSVRNYLSGVKTWANILDDDTEAFNSPTFKLTITGLSKLNLSVPNRRPPFFPEHLMSIYK